ncbi:hypothetical protein M569_14586, partial [Genlisea aurea]
AAEEEQRMRRMKSNRESARRSRLRKRKHFESLRDEANVLRGVNVELMIRRRLTESQNQCVAAENYRLRAEAEMLRRRLSDVRRTLILRQLNCSRAWPCST